MSAGHGRSTTNVCARQKYNRTRVIAPPWRRTHPIPCIQFLALPSSCLEFLDGFLSLPFPLNWHDKPWQSWCWVLLQCKIVHVEGDPNWISFHVLWALYWKMSLSLLEWSQRLNICWLFCWCWCYDAHNNQTHYFWICKSIPWWEAPSVPHFPSGWWVEPMVGPCWNETGLDQVRWTRFNLVGLGWSRLGKVGYWKWNHTGPYGVVWDGTKKWNHSNQGPGWIDLTLDGSKKWNHSIQRPGWMG